jgi:hypothetical protein
MASVVDVEVGIKSVDDQWFSDNWTVSKSKRGELRHFISEFKPNVAWFEVFLQAGHSRVFESKRRQGGLYMHVCGKSDVLVANDTIFVVSALWVEPLCILK